MAKGDPRVEKSALAKVKSIIFYAFRGFDPQLGFIFLGLAGISFIVFLSAGQGTPVAIVDQIRNLFIAFVIMWIVSQIPPKWLEMAAVWVYGIGIALLIAVAIFGLIKKGARRWINLGITIQPSEIMKIAVPLMLAWYFQKREGIRSTLDYLVAGLILALPVFLI